MPLETNFNTPPYFDDYDANNNFYRVLFRPSTAVQARELTQLQSILQDQVDKFGRHIFIEGSIVEGCSIYFDNKLDYIKILDNYSNGTAISTISEFVGKKVRSANTGLEAIVVDAISGFESANPDLNTLYIKYLNSGTYANGTTQKKYDASQVVQIRTAAANALYGTVTVGNSTVNAVGVGYSVGISEGVVFQKGFFIRVDAQSVIVTKYNNLPNGVSVGFKTNESVVTADSDESLLDNALGAPNYNAPGANRLKLTANLVVRTTDNTSVNATSSNTDNFFSIVDFESGFPTVVRTDPQYAQLGRQLAKRTYEESGHYILDPFELSVTANTSNTTYHSLAVDRGVGYVQGYRVEFINKKNTPIRKGTDVSSITDQSVGVGYGGYVTVNNFVGNFDTENFTKVSLRNASANAIANSQYSNRTAPGSEIGTAYVRAVDYNSGTPGLANATFNLYLYDINMANTYNFKDVRCISSSNAAANAFGDAVLTGSEAVLVDSNLDSLVFNIGRAAIANTSNRSYITRQVKSVTFTSGNNTTLTPDGANTVFADVGSLTQNQKANFIIIPTSANTGVDIGKPINIVTAGSITTTTNTATIATGLSVDFNADVYFNVERQNPAPLAKIVKKDVHVGIYANTTNPGNTVGPWPLGLSDVYKIKAVYQGATLSNTETNNVDYFTLDTGQRDSYYGHAYLKIKPGTGHTVTANQYLLVVLDCFQANNGSGNGYFTVDSYPIDDSVGANTVSTIKTAEVPIYVSANGSAYALRDSIDFRPVMTNTAVYATSNSTATVSPVDGHGAANTFNSALTLIPAPDTTAELNLNFYLGRRDKVTLTSSGKINVIEGIASLTPTTPKDQEGAMTLGVVNIPPYPSLTQAEARTYDRFDYLITHALLQQRRYTMRDVGVLDQRINNLEYYTLLSTLEQETDKLLITDSAGNNRFKNGIYVDSFNDFKIADITNPEFKASIDTKGSILRPKILNAYIPLTEKTLSNVTRTGSRLTLNYSHTPFITQPFASKVRNCAEALVYVWKGSVKLTPDGDHVPDIKYNPDIVVNLDLAAPFLALQEGGYFGTQFGSWQTTSTDVISNSVLGDVWREESFANFVGGLGRPIRQNATTTITTQANQVRDVINTNFNAFNQNFSFGEIVQDVTVQPFMRSRRIAFTATGLKPSTIVFPFFDDVSVANNVKISNSSLVDVGSLGGTLTTDSTGTLYGIFYLPENTFKTGERIFKLVDVQNLVSEAEAISTIATGAYTGSNIIIAKANASVNVNQPQLTQTVTQETQTVVTDVRTEESTNIVGWYDPIAQSFLVDDAGTGVPGITVTKIDLYFQAKHPTLGVEVQVREVDENTGYPTPRIVPGGRKIITSANINTSSDASTATTVTFDNPLYLENQKQYCFVVLPQGNNTDTKIWVAQIGGTDVTTNAPIYNNNPMGDLFTSSTNRVWVAYTKEDIKCVIYRADFTSLSGTINYRNTNTEYLSVNNFKSTFLTGEKVYVSNAVVTVASGATVNSSLSNSIIIGTTTAQSAFSVGDNIYISSNTGVITDVRTISALPNTTNIRVSANLTFVDNSASIGKLYANGDINGVVEFVDPVNGDLYIANSTANSTFNLTLGNTQTLIIGDASKARANLVSVDNVIYSVAVPQLSVARPPGTTVSLTFNGTPTSSFTRESLNSQVQNDIEIELVDFERRVLSRSNELANMGGNNSLELVATLSSTSSKISPILDDIKKSVLVVKNEISSGNTLIANNETFPGGNTVVTSKYVSKKVTLADGQDAEDIEIYLTANKPAGTEIYVYVKVQGAEDSDNFSDKYWSLMEQITPTSVVGSRSNFKEYNEYRYRLPVATAANIATVKTAARNSNNSNIIRYHTLAGSPVDDFKIFAVKIVMTSTGTHLIPRIADMRAIALQI